jgi:uncharacterized small protein (DUF1192 family)
MHKSDFGVSRGRTWLNAKHNDYSVNFAYPPVQGTHSDCYKSISEDKEIQPADGLDLAILTAGAYTSNEKEWKDVRQMFVSDYVRMPRRLLWVPKQSFDEDKELSGVLIEKDLQGKSLEGQMEIPQNLGNTKFWKQNDSGIYVYTNGEKQFVPSDKYKLGEHSQKSFAKDGFTRALLTEEGAELFAKTALDSKKTPWTCGLDVLSIENPEQRVALLDEDVGRLDLVGNYGGGGRDYLAFGVQCVGSPGQKNF